MISLRRIAASLSCVLLFTTTIQAHSWVACTDYRGNPNYYDPAQCYGYPRNWGNVAGGSGFGVDRGYNFQSPAGGNKPCRDPLGAAPDYGYSNVYPMAKYSPGSTVCLAWPSKNHVAATCTNPYIPDTALELYVSPSPTGSADPNQQLFNSRLVKNFTAHVNGVIDFKGFQNCPKFCENMDKSLCTQCFVVPSNLQSGKVYTFQWWWEFNNGDAPYTTCWEAMIGGSGSGSGSGTSTTGPKPSSTTGPRPSSTTGPRPSSTTGASVTPPPVCGNGNTGGSGTGLPVGGESVAVTTAPFIIPTTGSFDVIVAYTASGSRVLTVDILDTKSSPTWFGKGSATVQAGSGTVSIRVTVQNPPPVGPNYVLRAWSVDSKYANSADNWNYELSRNDFSVSVGGVSALYADSVGATACADQSSCDDLCGGADQVDTCDCDADGHVTVLCANTPAPTSTVNSSGMLQPIILLVVTVVAVMLL